MDNYDYDPARGQRRQRLTSSGDSESDEIIGIYVKQRFGFTEEKGRVGCPALMNLPLETIPATDEFEMMLEPLLPQLRNYLTSEKVDFEDIECVFRVPSTDNFSPQTTPPTVVIYANRESNVNKSWLRAVSLIRRSLNGFPSDVVVELLDGILEQPVFLAPINSDHWLIPRWGELEPHFLAELDSTMYGKWLTMDVIRVGFSEDIGDDPTVSVLVKETVQESEWARAERRFKEILTSAHLVHRVSIRFERGSISEYSDPPALREEDRRLAYTDSYKEPLGLGAEFGQPSISRASDGTPAGSDMNTLGGWVKITFADGSQSIFGLTNYHCVRIGMDGFIVDRNPQTNEIIQRYLSPDSGLYKADRYGFNAIQSQQYGAQRVSSPGLKCHSVTLQVERERLDTLINPELKQRIKESIVDRETFFAEKAHLGVPSFGSGYARTTSDHGRLNWALITPQSSRVGKNTIPDYTKFLGTPPAVADGTTQVHGVGSVHGKTAEDPYVYMVGARSGPVVGKFSHIRSSLRRGRFDLSNQSKSTEYMYVLAEGQQLPKFGQHGDSGSLVFNRDGVFVGLFFAGTREGNKPCCGYFQDAQALFEDIKKFMTEADPTRPVVEVELLS